MQRMLVVGFAFFTLCLGISTGSAFADKMVAPAVAQVPGKWGKGAPFPEPSEELVGGSVGGKFYVFGGLGPGWIPQGLVYEYDSVTDKWTKKKIDGFAGAPRRVC